MRKSTLSGKLFQQILSVILLVNILCGGLPATAQTKRGASKTAKTNQKKPVSAEQNTNPNKTVFPKPENSVLSQAWQTGELPQPLALPAGNTDELIAVLAQKIAAKNDESVPALLTALQIAGFFITDKNGQMLHTPPDGKGQGLPINGWEVASVARMYGDNRTVNLGELDRQLKSVPVLRGFAAGGGGSVTAVLMEGIRKNADNTRNPYLRVWARFIIELGKHSDRKYDLASGAAKAGQVNLDAIQHLLIMRRLYGDFWAMAEKFKVQSSKFKIQSRNEASFVKASFVRDFDNQESKVSLDSANFEPRNLNFEAAEDKVPCRLDGDAATISDATATTLGIGWDKALNKMENSRDVDIEKAGSRYAGFMTTANILLVYAKFIQTYAALETVISAEDSEPLVRTKNSVPGGRKKLQAFVRMNIASKWQDYNCLRKAVNIVSGLDFSTMNDGPLGGVGVQWGLTEGGAGDFYSNSGGVNQSGEQIVGFAADGAKRIQDKGVGAGKGLGNLTFNKTDDKGISEMILEGTPQKNEKKSMRVQPVRKQARVVTSIEIKAGEIKGDMVDVYGQWADGLPGLISMPAELLYRTSWAASGALIVPVQDWEECEGGWSGTITAIKKEHRKTPIANQGNLREAIKTEDTTLKAALKLNGEQDRNGGFSNAYFADIQVDYEESHYARNFYEKFSTGCIGGIIHSSQTQIFERKSKADGSGRITVFVSTGGTSGTLTFNTVRAVGEKSYSQVYKTGCPIYDQTNTKSTKEDDPFIYEVTGFNLIIDADPKNPDVLNGTKTVKDEYGSETTYSWNLAYCR